MGLAQARRRRQNGGQPMVRFWVRDQGIGHRRAAARPAVPGVRAGGEPADQAAPGDRPGPGHLQAPGRAARRQHRRRFDAGQGQHLLVHPAGGGRRPRPPGAPAARRPAGRADGATAKDGRPEVLVIDDDPGVGTLLRGMLERAGYRVTIAERAREGLIMARERLPDALVVDLGLPDASGFTRDRGAVGRRPHARPNRSWC